MANGEQFKTIKEETLLGLPTVPEWPGQSRN